MMEQKVVLITGGSRGIGAATARRFAAGGKVSRPAGRNPLEAETVGWKEAPSSVTAYAVTPSPRWGEGFGGGPHLSSFVISSFMVYIYQEKWKGRRPGPICKKLVRLPPAFL